MEPVKIRLGNPRLPVRFSTRSNWEPQDAMHALIHSAADLNAKDEQGADTVRISTHEMQSLGISG